MSPTEGAASVPSLCDDEIFQLRHELLRSRDTAIGAQAEMATLRTENAALRKDVARLEQALHKYRTLPQLMRAVRRWIASLVNQVGRGALNRVRKAVWNR